MEFEEQIILNLINQGYSGNDLRGHFKEEVSQIRPAMEAILAEPSGLPFQNPDMLLMGMF